MTEAGRIFRQLGAVFALLLASFCLIAIAIGVSVGIGDLPIPLATTFSAVTNRLGWTAVELNRIHETVIWDYRLSRALVAAFCGAGLALSGAIMQSLLRNPLAEPYVLGISAGASSGAVAIVILGVGAGAVSLSAGAFAGAFAAFFFVALLSNGTRGGADRTILAGVASSLGVNVGRARMVLFALTAMMTATIVSMVGSIGFVGLVVPHVARFVVGPSHVRLLPACAMTGAIFMVLADIAARALIPNQILPIGVVTALVGVPFFSIILYRFQRAS
ncbi:FecCD family ABC transporter permease [Rhizobium ruizarguesonis]|uniref:FecCD family ABC transporter permease n=1 Tax=Rhizobium ruizarguesonis TaxID=2081791 RepID=UPI00102F69CB|nr:iron ABC transporter permease [Rhizobium ruizarguesonis]TBD97848.1 iron ABC transporter permease [Rhizobium ruizarguesonis]TBE63994.1 iron ABC transporter permease [Rhizobium ruizarguesonis]TBE82154.1 iron ABC transporter permease [Rhizobium ruizarguesonis]